MDDPIDRTGPWWFVGYWSEGDAPIVEAWPGDLPTGAVASIAPGYYSVAAAAISFCRFIQPSSNFIREYRDRPGVRRQDNTGAHIRTLTFHRDPAALCRLFLGWWEEAIGKDDAQITRTLTELQALLRQRERDYEQLAGLRKQYETFLGANSARAE